MEHMFEDFFTDRWMRPFDFGHPFWRELPTPLVGRTAPRVDIINRDNEIILRAQIPGVDKKDLDVSVSDNTVTIKGHTSHEEKEERGDYYRRECSSGSFSRTLTLPSEVDGTKAKAKFNDGILELTTPKNEESKRHNIQIE
jgi:HSP20 family protein